MNPVYGQNSDISALRSWGLATQVFSKLASQEGQDAGWARHAPALREARIIEVELATVNRTIDDFDYYVESAGIDPFNAIDAMRKTQRPPFDSVFIGIRASLGGWPKDTLIPVGWLIAADSYLSISCQGVLRADDWTLDIGYADLDDPADLIWSTSEGRHPGAAVFPDLLFQLMAQEVSLVREAKLMPSQRNAVRINLGGKGQLLTTVPRAYHKILVTGSTTWVDANRRAIVASGHAWKLQHRIDVRAHWWVRVREGEGLVPEEFRKRLDPSYLWLDDNSPEIDPETWEIIAARGVAPREPGRWMGVLKRWIGPHQRGPTDGPYVPALWVVEPPSAARTDTQARAERGGR